MAKPCTNKVPYYNLKATEHSEKMFILSRLKPSQFVRIVMVDQINCEVLLFCTWSAGFVRAFISA